MYKTKTSENMPKPKKPKSKYHTLIMALAILGMAILYVSLWAVQFSKFRQDTLSKYLDNDNEIAASQLAETTRKTIEKEKTQNVEKTEGKIQTAENIESTEENQDAEDLLAEFLTFATVSGNFTLSVQSAEKNYIYMSESQEHFVLQIDDDIYICENEELYYKKNNIVKPLLQQDNILYEGYTELQDILQMLQTFSINVKEIGKPVKVKYQRFEYTCMIDFKKSPTEMLIFDITGPNTDLHVSVTNINNTHIEPINLAN